MGIEGFTSFMRSPTCDIFNPLHHEVNQDMEQPLCNYFVASSHNTYLTGDQLLSHSKTDMYAWVLQSGCRCVEVDCWDGPEGEPMVQHGYTLTSKIPFKSVIETINKYAFVNNQFPVILSIENHCSIQQQKKIAQYLRDIFGDKLDVGDVLSRDSKTKKLDSLLKESQIGDKEDSDSFSIRALLRATHQGLQKNLRQSSKGVLRKSHSRSLITTLKQKRHSKSRLSCQSVEKEDDVQEKSGREAGGQFNRCGRKRKTMKLSRDLSNLVVFTNSVASQECLNEGTPGDVLSFSETRAQSLVNHRTEQFLAFNQRQLSRIYPSAYRIDSSNFNPQFYWNVGCQLVALNYQTEGRMMQLNRSKFMVNGGIGYVLKPPPMCKGSFNPFSDDPLPAYPKKQLILKIISGQQLPKPPDSMLGDRGEIIDPFVEVEIIGLPVDCCKEQTRVVDDNGFNPVWEETLSFTLHMAELALVRFLVWDHDPIGRDFIGQRTVAFSSLMPGYRHVYLEGLTEASIFVHVSVHDVYGKWSPLVLNPSFTIMHFLGAHKSNQLRGIRGFFNRSSKSSVDTNSSCLRKRSLSDHLLRRTASAPAKGRKKTKMMLSESVASMSDHKNSSGAGAGACPFDRVRSSSVDLLIESSFPAESSTSPTSKTLRIKEFDQSGEASYLVIGCEDVKKEDIYVNYRSMPIKTKMHLTEMEKKHSATLSANSQVVSDRPETSSNNTAFTAAPSISSSSSSSSSYTPSSAAPVSPVRMSYGLKSPSSLHDSTVSRLIDAVSLGTEQDTCRSISALIDQFESTVDQNSLTTSAHDTTPFQTSSSWSNGPKTMGDLRSPLTINTASPKKKLLMSPQKATQETNHMNNGICSSQKISQANTSTSALVSSPETTEIEEVYTILDEEVLLPVSMFNLRKQTVQIQKDSTGVSSSNCLRSTPTKADQNLGKTPKVGWNGVDRQWSQRKEPEDTEERVYEEVNDHPTIEPIRNQGTPKRFPSPSSNIHLQIFQHSTRRVYREVELNVDEDPLEIIPTLPKCSNHWEGLTSPDNHEAIYQNHESTPIHSQQKLPYSYSQSQYPTRSSHASFSQAHSPISQPLHQLSNPHQQQSDFHPPGQHKHIDPGPSRSSPLHPNSYPMCHSNFDTTNNTRDLKMSYVQQRSFSGSEIFNKSPQDRQGNKHTNTEKAGCFYNGFSSVESLPSAVPANISRGRGPCYPSYKCETFYSQMDHGCITPSSDSSASQNIQPLNQRQTKLSLPKQLGKHEPQQINSKLCLETKAPLQSDLEPPSTYVQSSTTKSTTHSPCKSKSLGDLTSEDISCNFQSKYHIISRSFITSHMRKQKHKETTGEAAPHSRSMDPLTEQLRKLVSLEADDGVRENPQFQQEDKPQASSSSSIVPRDLDDSPPVLTRRLSSRSQSRVRHINSRARERQQEALKSNTGGVIDSTANIGGVVWRNKPALQNLPPNRHSTGSYIAGYLGCNRYQNLVMELRSYT
uniref:Phosphoinositide phospholipase C n=1 Tax=Nothobranchius pienaari TaxID=704102 RepID=A0A1A8Q3E8_9TELE